MANAPTLTKPAADVVTAPGHPRNPVGLFVAGAVGLVASGVVARTGTVTSPERAVFRAINGLPGALYPVMWPLEQAGNLAAGPVVAVVAALCHRRRLALAAILVTLIDVEAYVKHVVTRERPGATIPGAILRGDVPVHGQSFPSGHAILITSLAVLVTVYLRGRWRLGALDRRGGRRRWADLRGRAQSVGSRRRRQPRADDWRARPCSHRRDGALVSSRPRSIVTVIDRDRSHPVRRCHRGGGRRVVSWRTEVCRLEVEGTFCSR